MTTIDNPLSADTGQEIVAEFCFNMPRLAKGEYSICTALGDGTNESHVQHHWIHDAVLFRSHTTSVASGLIGIPMQSVCLVRHTDAAAQ